MNSGYMNSGYVNGGYMKRWLREWQVVGEFPVGDGVAEVLPFVAFDAYEVVDEFSFEGVAECGAGLERIERRTWSAARGERP